MAMPLPTFFFYCGNILLLTAYIVLSLMSARPGGVTGVQDSGPVLKWSGVVFFALAAALHFDLAVHTILRIPLFEDNGSRISWDFSIIVFAKMISVGMGLLGIGIDTRKRRGLKR